MPKTRPAIFLILTLYLALGLTYGMIVPPFEGLDEPGHFEVVRYIAENDRLPVLGQEEEPYLYRQEAAQPPLYYLLSAGWVRLLNLHADDALAYIRFKPRVFCGPNAPALYDNRAVFYHNPHREAFPWQGTLRMLHLLRIWSALLQAITVGMTYILSRRLFPEKPAIALMGTAIVAFNPQFLFTVGGVTNDNLVTPLTTVGLYLILRIWADGLSIRRSVLIGLIAGLAGLSKLSGWLLLPLAAGVIAGYTFRNSLLRESLPRLLFHGVLIGVTALAISGWWLWRNWQLYGDPTALSPMLDIVGRRMGRVFPLQESRIMFLSFWGQIPCAFYPSAFYVPFALLTTAGLVGLIVAWHRSPSQERQAILTLAGWSLLVLVGWMRWDMMTYAGGGRLLFPALPAIATLMALGIYHLVRHRIVAPLTVILTVIMAWWAVARILPAFFAPPPTRPLETIHPTHPTDAAFGDSIRLLGYDLHVDAEKGSLDIRLYWLTAGPIDRDYNLALQLVSVAPGRNDMLWTYDSWPGRGNYPTSAWQPGRAILDRYRFHLPRADFPTQAWDLQVVLYDEEPMARLPVRIDGVPAGDRMVLARLRWPGTDPECPEESRLTGDVRFGDAIALTHAQVIPEGSGTQVILCWKALRSLPQDDHVFVHLYGEDGNLLQAGDGPPMEGAFPLSLWAVGDIVRDPHFLGAVVRPGYRIAVGWYSLNDGQRLSASYAGEPVRDNAVVIWPDQP